MFPESMQNFFFEFILPVAHEIWASKLVMAMGHACYCELVRGPQVEKQ